MIIRIVSRHKIRLNVITIIIQYQNPFVIKHFHENHCIHTAEVGKFTGYGRSFIYSVFHFYNSKRNYP